MEDFNNLLCCSFFLLLLSFPVFFFFFFYIIKKKKIGCSSSSKQGSILNFYEIVKNGHRFLDWSTERLQASATHTVALPGIVLTASPSNVEHVVKTNFCNYPKGPLSIATLEDLLGRGIFNSNGEHWLVQRKLASLGFNSKTIRTFLLDAVRSEVVDRLLPFLSAAVAESAVVDLQDVLERFAFDNICKVVFDVDPGRLSSRGGGGEGDAFACSYEVATGVIMSRFKMPRLLWSLLRLLGLGRERALKRELAVLKDFAAKVVNEKKKKKKERRDDAIGTDLLSLVMAEGDFSDEFLRDLVLNYVLAGRDTTSSAMSWFFWLVSSRPEVERRIVGEMESVRAKHGSSAGGSMFTLEELREMNYLQAALSEAMRLYPPVPVESRVSIEEDVLPDGTKVAKGAMVMHSPYSMGRMESIWGEDCREFRPERWLDSADGVFQPRNPYEYPVFHGGPRMCLGKDMAYIQMKAVVASVMERFVVDVVEGEREPELVVVLRMKKGLPVKIRAR